MYMYIFICKNVFVYMYIYIYVYIYIDINIYTCMYAYTDIYISSLYKYTYSATYTHIYMYHLYTYIHSPPPRCIQIICVFCFTTIYDTHPPIHSCFSNFVICSLSPIKHFSFAHIELVLDFPPSVSARERPSVQHEYGRGGGVETGGGGRGWWSTKRTSAFPAVSACLMLMEKERVEDRGG